MKKYIDFKLYLIIINNIIFFCSIYFNIIILKYLSFITFIILFILEKSDNIIYPILMLLPNQRMLVLKEGGTSIIIYLIIIILIKYYKNIKINNFEKYILLLILFISEVSVFYTTRYIEFTYIIKFVIVILFLKLNNNINIDKSINYFIIGIILSALFGKIKNGNLIRFTGIYNDANNYASIVIVGITILLIKRKTIIEIIEMILLTYIGIATLSRGFILTLIIVLLLYFINTKHKIKLILLNVCTIIIFIYLNTTRVIFQEIILRIIQPTNMDISNGRILLWKEYIYIIIRNFKNLLFGIPITEKTIYYDSHNFIIQSITDFGIINTILIIIIYIYYIYNGIKIDNKMNYTILLISIILPMVFLNSLISNQIIILIIYSVLIVNNINNSIGNIK